MGTPANSPQPLEVLKEKCSNPDQLVPKLSLGTPCNTPNVSPRDPTKDPVPTPTQKTRRILRIPRSESDDKYAAFYKEHEALGKVLTDSVVRAFYYHALHNLPFTNTMICDFGLLTSKHEEAVRTIVTGKKIDPVLWQKHHCDGIALTQLLQGDTGLVFMTSYDYLSKRRVGSMPEELKLCLLRTAS